MKVVKVDAEIAKAWAERAELVTHELVQPLNAILLMTEVLLRSSLADDQRVWLERVRASSIQISHIVGDLADTSQLETGRLPLVVRKVDLCDLVQRSIASVPEAVPRTTVHRPPNELIVRGDPNRLEQVIVNLLSNALKHGTADTEIVVALGEVDDQIMVAVSNRGEPLAPDELARLFGPRVGLGLQIAKLLVETHGGRIWAESQQGTTTFRFTLPTARLSP